MCPRTTRHGAEDGKKNSLVVVKFIQSFLECSDLGCPISDVTVQGNRCWPCQGGSEERGQPHGALGPGEKVG